jgi:hypothetical protein
VLSNNNLIYIFTLNCNDLTFHLFLLDHSHGLTRNIFVLIRVKNSCFRISVKKRPLPSGRYN